MKRLDQPMGMSSQLISVLCKESKWRMGYLHWSLPFRTLVNGLETSHLYLALPARLVFVKTRKYQTDKTFVQQLVGGLSLYVYCKKDKNHFKELLLGTTFKQPCSFSCQIHSSYKLIQYWRAPDLYEHSLCFITKKNCNELVKNLTSYQPKTLITAYRQSRL